MDPFQQVVLENWSRGVQLGTLLAIFLIFLFQVKHMIVDFFIQDRFPYMWMNKHKFLHWGGWLHAGSHAVGSFVIFTAFHPASRVDWLGTALLLCAAELIVHFLIDLTKMRIGH